ncbi:hypothetical protein BGX26_004110 [Mortierella sp. AD094]|nr:hypothetical protein BGX26_004110 [Mortierella sp. AD094]
MSTNNLHHSQSSTTLTEDNQGRNQSTRTLANSASSASFDTSFTLSPLPTRRSFANAAFRSGSDSSMFSTHGHHPTSTDSLYPCGPWFKDKTGRTVILRGVNLSGASKMPVGSSSHEPKGFLDDDGTKVSFVGRPFPLEDADEHLTRLKYWGFNMLRFIVTWEAIEHAGPGKYDYDYFEYLAKVLQKCKEYGFKCFIDPHQDVWSRFSGGSGAPLWTLYLAGLDPSRFKETNAALVHNFYDDPENFPKMVWATNYNKLAAATMFTLFFGGSSFAPNCVVNDMNIQDYLQTHYMKSYMALAVFLTEQHGIEDDVVIGYDTLNEPSAGWIGVEDIRAFPHHQELKKDATPTPLQSMILGQGHQQTVEFWVSTFFGPKRKGSKTINPAGVTAWLSKEQRDEKDKRFGWTRSPEFPRAGECIWAQHGVWDISTQQVLKPEYFYNDPETEERYDFDSRAFLPFCRRFAQAIRTIHSAAIMFLEPPVNEIPPSLPPPHDDEDVAHFDITSRVVYAPHWYDGLTLLNKRWNFFNIDYLGVKRGRYPNYAAAVKIGEKAIKECFRYQLECIKKEGQAAIGQHPTLIGEIGIPYDMNDGKSYKPNGNYKDQIKAMDANMYALESNHLNFTLWNYCPDNCHKWGDLWNGEDLSLFSTDDLRRDTNRLAKKGSQNSLSDAFVSRKVGPYSSITITTPPGLTEAKKNSIHPRVDALSASSSAITSKSSSSSDVSLLASSPASGSTQDGSKLINFNPNLGGRAVVAFCRPFAQKIAGLPLELSFSLSTVTFKFSFKRIHLTEPEGSSHPLKAPNPAKIDEPTEIYLPRIHFPCAGDYFRSLGESAPSSAQGKKEPLCSVTVSGGRWEWNEEEQILYWWTNDDCDVDRVQSQESITDPDQVDGKIFEITVVGKKWAGNSLNGRTSASGGAWGAISECCRLS